MADALQIATPIDKKTASRLRAGNFVEITGTLITARDRAHKFLLEGHVPTELKKHLKNALVYHCGPIVGKNGSKFCVISAGPTTSARFGMYAPALVKRYGISAVMGKGGMRPLHVPYLSAVGGAGALLAKHIKRVSGVYNLREFGMAEATWVFQVEGFPAVVTADARGKSLHQKVLKESIKNYKGGDI